MKTVASNDPVTTKDAWKPQALAYKVDKRPKNPRWLNFAWEWWNWQKRFFLEMSGFHVSLSTGYIYFEYHIIYCIIFFCVSPFKFGIWRMSKILDMNTWWSCQSQDLTSCNRATERRVPKHAARTSSLCRRIAKDIPSTLQIRAVLSAEALIKLLPSRENAT